MSCVLRHVWACRSSSPEQEDTRKSHVEAMTRSRQLPSSEQRLLTPAVACGGCQRGARVWGREYALTGRPQLARQQLPRALAPLAEPFEHPELRRDWRDPHAALQANRCWQE